MSVSAYFGLTESGKSYHVQKHVIPSWQKVIVFDPAHCFEDGTIVTNPTDAQLMRILTTYYNRESFRLIIRPGGRGTRLVLFNKIAEMAFLIGTSMGKKIDKSKRIQLVIDESDSICSPHFKSEPLHHLVNEARHDNVDSHFIARNPNRIHTDIRINATKIVTFMLQNAKKIELFKENFDELTEKIRILPKYWRLEWNDTGVIGVYNENNQKQETFLGKSQENPKKKRGR